MKPIALFTLSSLLVALPAAGLARLRAPQADDAQEAREEAFAKLLTGARLAGWFTDSTRPDAAPTKDSYTISRVEKEDDETWLFEALIGETGLKIPLHIPVQWAGNTPVITLDHFAVPQMGFFDARVLFHGQSYAGVWSGDKHSGEMAGRIERASVTAAGAGK